MLFLFKYRVIFIGTSYTTVLKCIQAIQADSRQNICVTCKVEIDTLKLYDKRVHFKSFQTTEAPPGPLY